MSGGHGGKRLGAGRKRKPLAEKLLYAANGNHKITKLKEPEYADFDSEAATADELGAKSQAELGAKNQSELGGARIEAKPFDESEYSDIAGKDMPPVSEYLRKMTKNTNENLAPEIYEKTWEWLRARKCEQFIKKELIEQYALYIARWVQCEEGINTYGLLAKHPTTGSPIASPYVSMGLNFLKQANNIWGQIFQVVRENSSIAVDGINPADEVMARLLKGKG